MHRHWAGVQDRTVSMLQDLFWLAQALIMLVVALPVGRFMVNGWFRRRHEFSNRLKHDCLEQYRLRFWPGKKPNFNKVYNSIAGLWLYCFPILLLAATLFLLGGLAAETAIRAGFQQFFHFYHDQVTHDVAQRLANAQDSMAQLQGIFYPFDDVMLDFASLASVGGAYLYTVGVVIQGFRTRSLTPTDLIWCSFRLIIAIPLGLCLAKLPPDGFGAFLAFALGAFPIDALNQLLRRVVNMRLKITEDPDSTDRVVNLSGVTPDIAGRLNAEGIQAVQQLAMLDPVSLAIRTGLSFGFILNLVSQAQAWCFLGDRAKCLQQLGLGDARPIADFVALMDDKGEKDPQVAAIIGAAACRSNTDPEALIWLFRRIANDDYTKFLLFFATRHEPAPARYHPPVSG